MKQIKAIVDELRRARVQSGVGQFDFAETLGYNRGTIAKYETGRGVPSLQMACNWAEAVGLEIVVRPKE